MKTIYYYQSFCGLEKLYSHVQDIDTIILSSNYDEIYKMIVSIKGNPNSILTGLIV